MNNDGLQGQWTQIRGKAKALWGKITDDDLDLADGKVDVLAGVLQEKYGYTYQRAVRDIDKHLAVYESNPEMKTGPTPAR